MRILAPILFSVFCYPVAYAGDCFFHIASDGMIVGENVNLREAPAMTGRVLGVIPDKTYIKILERNESCVTVANKSGRWIRVQSIDLGPIRSGWVFDPHVVYASMFTRLKSWEGLTHWRQCATAAESCEEYVFASNGTFERFLVNRDGSGRRSTKKGYVFKFGDFLLLNNSETVPTFVDNDFMYHVEGEMCNRKWMCGERR